MMTNPNRTGRALRCVALAAGLLTLQAAQADNTLDNSSFESGLTGWTTSGTVSTSSVSVHTGTLAAAVTGDASAISATLATATPVSGIVQFSFWAQSSLGPLSLLVYTFSDGSTSSDSIFDLGNSDWTLYDLTSTLKALGEGKSLLGFSIYGNSGAISYIDDVVLNLSPVSELSPLSLWTVGLLALGLTAWRQQRHGGSLRGDEAQDTAILR